MARLLPQLDGVFHSQFSYDTCHTNSFDNCNVYNSCLSPDHNELKIAQDVCRTNSIDNSATCGTPLSPDLEEVNVSDILNLLNNGNACNSSEESESDSSDVTSPTWDSSRISFTPQISHHSFSSDGEYDVKGDMSSPDSPARPDLEPHVSIRDGLSVHDIAAEYDSNLIASRGEKRRGRKPSIKSWRRKNEYSELLKKFIEKYQCENTKLKYETMQLEKTKREMLKILQECACQNTLTQTIDSYELSPCEMLLQ